MKKRSLLWLPVLCALFTASYARQDHTVCGTHPEKGRE